MRELFARVKEVPLEAILARYGVAVPERRDARLACPIHGGTDPNFSVRRDTNSWYCHSRCQMGGDGTALVAVLEGMQPIDAARLIQAWFGLEDGAGPVGRVQSAPAHGEVGSLEVITWRLDLDARHPALARYGISPALADEFGIGYCDRGVYRERLCFPVEDPRGALVGYVARAVGPEVEPKYRLTRGLAKSRVLYNYHRVTADWVLLVEGPRDVVRLHALRRPVVASLGSRLSAAQVALLSRFCCIGILYDADEAGDLGARAAAAQLAPFAWVHQLRLPPGEDPASVDEDILEEVLGDTGGPPPSLVDPRRDSLRA